LPTTSDPEQGLRPAQPEAAMALLAECLTLCAPSGMTGDDRREWLKVAFKKIRDIPADLLAEATDAAQGACDHPSKIVRFIVQFTDDRWADRRRMRSRLLEGAEAQIEDDAAGTWIPQPGELEQIKREAAERLKAGRNA
jgi:hypothetical protein